MYVIREVLNCKPGKVRQMVEKFRSISTVLKEMGQRYARDQLAACNFARLPAT